MVTSIRVAVKLIRRNTIDFSYHSLKENVTYLMERAMRASMAHFRRTLAMDDDIYADVLPNTDNFMFTVNLSIGQPPISLFTAMDTGSSLLCVKSMLPFPAMFPTLFPNI
ncbi:hypothetical protein SLE2022_151550 [Rubroshorea leprosula]